MTDKEKKQPSQVFLNAGKNAFKMRIYKYNNPYKLNPYRSLWANGYRKAEQEYEQQSSISRAIQAAQPVETE